MIRDGLHHQEFDSSGCASYHLAIHRAVLRRNVLFMKEAKSHYAFIEFHPVIQLPTFQPDCDMSYAFQSRLNRTNLVLPLLILWKCPFPIRSLNKGVDGVTERLNGSTHQFSCFA